MSSVADREWRLVREESRDGPTNMALDEVAARTAVEDGVRTVRVYQWQPSCLSMGYRQAAESVDWAYCEREGIDVTRRQTGGGGIYHDEYADVSYSIVAPAEELPGALMECYEMLCEPVLDAIRSVGVNAGFAEREHESIHEPSCYLRGIHPAHDVLAYGDDAGDESGGSGYGDDAGDESGGTGYGDDGGDESGGSGGRKLSGNAQYRQRDAVIQHGSISYDLAVDHHLGVFADCDVTPERFRERVTSVREESGTSRAEFVRALEDHLADWCDAEEGAWTEDELAAAQDLVETKYDADAWVRDRED